VFGATLNHVTLTFPSGVVGETAFSALIAARIGPGPSSFTNESSTRGGGTARKVVRRKNDSEVFDAIVDLHSNQTLLRLPSD
jgi:hypothetical protein